jgi:hypothetical protein
LMASWIPEAGTAFSQLEPFPAPPPSGVA